MYLHYYFNMAIKIKLFQKTIIVGFKSKVFSYKSLVACTIFILCNDFSNNICTMIAD